LLGGALQRIIDDFDAHWHSGVLPAWEARHREVLEGRRRLKDLDARAGAGDLPFEEAIERARLTESFGAGPYAALDQYRALHARAPDDALAGFALVERAIEREARLILAGCECLRDYCWRKGRKQEAHDWRARVAERARLLHAADRERSVVSTSDKLDKHGGSDEVIAGLCAQLQAVPDIRKAYFVRKRVKHFPERPCYVLGFIVQRGRQRKRRIAEAQKRIVESVQFPGETLILSAVGANFQIGRRLGWMRGSRIL
jgi:hypothetical protein